MEPLKLDLPKVLAFYPLIRINGVVICNYDRQHCDNPEFLIGVQSELFLGDFIEHLTQHIRMNHSELLWTP